MFEHIVYIAGYAFENIGEDRKLFPAVGLLSPNQSIKANFGQEQFKYDIDFHTRCARAQNVSTETS